MNKLSTVLLHSPPFHKYFINLNQKCKNTSHIKLNHTHKFHSLGIILCFSDLKLQIYIHDKIWYFNIFGSWEVTYLNRLMFVFVVRTPYTVLEFNALFIFLVFQANRSTSTWYLLNSLTSKYYDHICNVHTLQFLQYLCIYSTSHFFRRIDVIDCYQHSKSIIDSRI